MKDVGEEVGPSNVVQVVADSARACKLVGLMVKGAHKHIFGPMLCTCIEQYHA